jgi:hypothetical protein
LFGYLAFDRKTGTCERFDLAASGDHWGESNLTRNARPGRKPLGILFELTHGDRAADRVAPQFARDIGGYFRTGN